MNVLLYKATHNTLYRQRAQQTAAAAYNYYVTGGRLDAQPPFFNSIFFKNLLLLESVTGGHKYRDAMNAYGDRMWSGQRDAASGLFMFNADGTTEAIQQAAMIQIYAVLGWSPSKYALLY